MTTAGVSANTVLCHVIDPNNIINPDNYRYLTVSAVSS